MALEAEITTSTLDAETGSVFVTTINTDHAQLTHLSYAESGHTGFASSSDLAAKQDALTAGSNISIEGNTISATDTVYTAGTGISIVNNVISNTQTSAEWGNIEGTLSNQTDLQTALNLKANSADLTEYTASEIDTLWEA